MPDEPTFDAPAAHRRFSVDCFNRTWSLIDKPNRTGDEDEEMVLLATASLWHWTRRADVTDRNLSIGHWLLSRVCALTGAGAAARRHGLRSLHRAAGSPPFYVGCAHEAVARAASVLGDRSVFDAHLASARQAAAAVADPAERKALDDDLNTLAFVEPSAPTG